jgi:hypothetical protein
MSTKEVRSNEAAGSTSVANLDMTGEDPGLITAAQR